MSILRWRQVLLVAVLLLAAVLLVRSQPAPAASTPAPAAVTSIPAVADPVLVDVATRFVAAYQAGSHAGTGGRVWLGLLAPVTTPELLAAVEFVDPESISDAPVVSVSTGAWTATVVLSDGTTWVLRIIGARVSAVERA